MSRPARQCGALMLGSLLVSAACTREKDSASDSRATARRAHVFDDSGPPLPPVPRRTRFYRDPDTNEPPITLLMSVRADQKTRFILIQTPMDGGYLAVVADSAGRIPVFDTQQDARSYIDRNFPLITAGRPDTATDAIVKGYQDMMSQGAPMHIDVDAIREWANDPAARKIGPVDLSDAWETLAAADAASPPAQFDPMGMTTLANKGSDNDRERFDNELAMTGMKLSGIAMDARRSRGLSAKNAGWPRDTAIWNDRDDALLARIMRAAMADFRSRLSPEAAQTNVAATWGAPRAPMLSATFLGSGKPELEQVLQRPALPNAAEIDAKVRSQVEGTFAPGHYRGVVSPGALARYTREQAEYAAEMRAFLRLSTTIEDEQRRSIGLRIWIRNDGDRQATRVSVRLRFPRGVTVVPSGSEAYPPFNPPDMPAAAAYENPAAKRVHMMPKLRPSYREQGMQSMYNRAETIVRTADGSTTVSGLGVAAIEKHGGADIQQVTMRFPSWQSVRPFTIDVEMQAGNGPIAKSTLRVNATVARR